MDKIRFGEGHFQIQAVITEMAKNSLSFAVLLESIETFGRSLELTDAQMFEIRKKLNKETLQAKEALYEILKIWKASKGRGATLKVLYDVLTSMNIVDIAERLHEKFSREVDELGLNVQGRIYKLDKLLENPASQHPQYDLMCRKLADMQNKGEPVELIKKSATASKKPVYYIPRTMSQRTKLKLNFFSDPTTKDFIFLVKGASITELGKVAGKEAVEKSGKQIKRNTINARFIKLEHDNDYDRICKTAKKAVHVIHKKDDSYFWVKSNCKFGDIKNYFENEAITLTEEEFIKLTLTSPRPSSTCIGDTAGMGKSLLLMNIATRIKISCPDNIVLFIELPLLVQQGIQIDSKDSAIKAVVTYACNLPDLTFLLEQMLKSESLNFDLFLDGYDEVMHDKMHIADAFLRYAKSLKNVRLFVATRPHFKLDLEYILKTISYEILPFDESNQIEFFEKFWENHKNEEYRATSGESLHNFSQKCLKSLQERLTDKNREIAGVPLQCYMLAEVLAEDAKRASEIEGSFDFQLEFDTIFDMYENLIHFKFQKLKQTFNDHEKTSPNANRDRRERKLKKQSYFNAHVLASIRLLFPDWEERFKKFLALSNETSDAVMYSIGLIENNPNANEPRFIHRTFAEYFFTKFLCETIGRCGVSMDFIFGKLLGGDGLKLIQPILNSENYRPFPKYFRLNYPVMAYFLDEHLRNFREYGFIDHKLISNKLKSNQMKIEGLCASLNACCCNDLVNCFDVIKDIIEEFDKDAWTNSILWEKFLKLLPHLTILHSNSDALIRKVIDFFLTDLNHQKYLPEIPEPNPNVMNRRIDQYKFEEFFYHVSSLIYDQDPSSPMSHEPFKSSASIEYEYPWIPNCTPLHVAVFKGNCFAVQDLLQKYENCIHNVKYLMHLCVYHSAIDSVEIVENKTEILDLLQKESKRHNLNWLEEKFNSNLTPLLFYGAHLSHLKKLVSLGANINAISTKHGSVLHSITGDLKLYLDTVIWALDNGINRNLVNSKNEQGFTPLHVAVYKFKEKVDDEILNLFKLAGSDFNCINCYDQPLIFTALETENFEFAEKILKYGANINCTTKRGNAAHFVFLDYFNGCRFKDKASVLQWLFKMGFTLINDKSIMGLTPLHMAMNTKYLSIDVLDLLFSKGADITALDCLGDSVLFHAIRNHQKVEIIQKLIQHDTGLNLKYRNNLGKTIFHLITYSGDLPTLKFLLDQADDLNVPDRSGDSPLHLLQAESKSICECVSLLTSKGARFDIKNRGGYFPLSLWIFEGKSYTTLACLADIKEQLSINQSVASQAISALILREATRRPYYASQEEEDRIALTTFFQMLIEMGGQLVFKNLSTRIWKSLSDLEFQKVSITINKEFKDCLRQKGVTLSLEKVSVRAKTDFQNLVYCTNVSPEVVLVCLLCCKEYTGFDQLCAVFAHKIEPKEIRFPLT